MKIEELLTRYNLGPQFDARKLEHNSKSPSVSSQVKENGNLNKQNSEDSLELYDRESLGEKIKFEDEPDDSNPLWL
jgi:hypothetical protein